MADKTLEMTMLFDFYGELLTEKQREYFDFYYNDDLSLAEIAGNVGISRQGVRDIIVRAEATLKETEAKTGLVRRFSEMREIIERAQEAADELAAITDGAAAEKSLKLRRILDELKG